MLIRLDVPNRVADPVLGSTILQRRKEFIMPSVVKQFIGIFGGNLLQVSKRILYLKSVDLTACGQDNGEAWYVAI